MGTTVLISNKTYEGIATIRFEVNGEAALRAGGAGHNAGNGGYYAALVATHLFVNRREVLREWDKRRAVFFPTLVYETKLCSANQRWLSETEAVLAQGDIYDNWPFRHRGRRGRIPTGVAGSGRQ